MKKKSLLITCIILLAAIIGNYFFANRKTVVVVNKRLDHFPIKFGDYTSRDVYMATSVVNELDTDVYIFRDYFNSKGDVFNLYIGYYGTQKGGRTGHNPNACYPSSGYSITDEEKEKITAVMKDRTRQYTLTRMKVVKDGISKIIYHWYQSSGDKISDSGIALNMNRFESLMLHNRNDGAFVRVTSNVRDSEEETMNMLRDVIKQVLPLIEKYWPIEGEMVR